jgi:hypothetical protein
MPHSSLVPIVAMGRATSRDHDPSAPSPRHTPMFTSIGLPQFGLIVLVLIIFIIYTQRHRF